MATPSCSKTWSLAAVNAGLAKAREAAAQSLASVTGGLPPGLFPDLGAGPGGEGR